MAVSVRSSYINGQADCAITGMGPCPEIVQSLGMGSELGKSLRAWREHLGKTLEQAAELIAKAAEEAGVPKGSKKVPRTHASLIRWELGQVSHNMDGLRIIAAAYGTTVARLQEAPPKDPAIEQRVEEFREFLNTGRRA